MDKENVVYIHNEILFSVKDENPMTCNSMDKLGGQYEMEETVRQLMISKFGRVVNLEALQTLSVNTTLEELKIRKLRKELANAKEMKMWEQKIAQMRWELMMKTKEHTRKLYQMNDLCVEKKKLDSRLNTLQNQQVLGYMCRSCRIVA
nr:uncharacterized protein LOC110567868 isoform X3 [Aotus nancymaae]